MSKYFKNNCLNIILSSFYFYLYNKRLYSIKIFYNLLEDTSLLTFFTIELYLIKLRSSWIFIFTFKYRIHIVVDNRHKMLNSHSLQHNKNTTIVKCVTKSIINPIFKRVMLHNIKITLCFFLKKEFYITTFI